MNTTASNLITMHVHNLMISCVHIGLSYESSKSKIRSLLYFAFPFSQLATMLNQVCRPVAGVYLSVICVHVSVSVCPPPRLLITNGVMQTQYHWLNKLYSFYMAAIIGIISRRGLSIDVHCRNQYNRNKLKMHIPLFSL